MYELSQKFAELTSEAKKVLDEIKDKMLEMDITLNMKLKDEVRVAFNKKLEKEEMKSDAS